MLLVLKARLLNYEFFPGVCFFQLTLVVCCKELDASQTIHIACLWRQTIEFSYTEYSFYIGVETRIICLRVRNNPRPGNSFPGHRDRR